MRFPPVIAVATAIATLWLLGAAVFTAPADALTQVEIDNLSYESCPPEIGEGAVVSGGGSGRAASCYLVSGQATNTTDRLVYDADVFGRIYDANGNPVKQNRTRIGLIEEIPPGTTDFSIRITVPANQPEPLKLEQFKAAGFSGRVRR